MPIKVNELPKVARSGRESKYDFTELFDGDIYVIVQGSEDEVEASKADYSCKTDSMRQTVYSAAQKAGHALSTRSTTHEGREAVAVQVTGPYIPRKDRPADENGKTKNNTATDKDADTAPKGDKQKQKQAA